MTASHFSLFLINSARLARLVTAVLALSLAAVHSWAGEAAAVGATAVGSTKDSSPASDGARPERLFLQQLSSHSVIVKWRGAARTACVFPVLAGMSISAAANVAVAETSALRCATAQASNGDHWQLQFEQLSPDTEYGYIVGDYSDKTLRFSTAPEPGKLPQDGNIHIWLIGDSGTATSRSDSGKVLYPGQAQAVMEGFLRYNREQHGQENPAKARDEPLDLLLMLGDNAYTEGTDAQWQGAVFDLYRELLSQTVLWPTIGNHEMGSAAVGPATATSTRYAGASSSANPNDYHTAANIVPRRTPYLDIFTLPAKAELGGVPSGTEQYYAFDYGTVHIVSLDSQLSARDDNQRAAMRDWLVADLQANQLPWTVVIFHHPPYTRGSHDSDTTPSLRFNIDTPIIHMREEFTPLFEQYGVDMVYSGHSHSYERSYYLNGHRGDAQSFDAKLHVELNAQGLPATGQGDQAYRQISTGSQLDDKVVYTVAGSSGKVKLGSGKLDHPAHVVQVSDAQQRHGLAELGSVVLDIGDTTLTARFINERGEVLDTVSMHR